MKITTFRRDVETDGRRAVVAFSDDCRTKMPCGRDFTMNALYARRRRNRARPDRPRASQTSLARRHPLHRGSAEDRIREDYLRILRFFPLSCLVCGTRGSTPRTLAA